MTNNPLDIMYEEHDIIMKAEEIINNCEGLWNSDAQGYKNLVVQLITFFRSYADGYHHRKEEEVLFPAIKNHPEFILDEMIDEFEEHHEDFRASTQEIEEALNDDDFTTAQKILMDYCNDLLDHIAAENEELFVLAESLMSEQDLETIFFRFKDIDRELGIEHKKELEELIKNL